MYDAATGVATLQDSFDREKTIQVDTSLVQPFEFKLASLFLFIGEVSVDRSGKVSASYFPFQLIQP